VDETLKKCLTFMSFYIPEGLMYSITTVIIPLYLSFLGYSPGIIGVVMAITMIPWIVKIVWGSIVDIFHKKGRRFFVILGAVLASVVLFSISLFTLPLAIFTILFFIARAGVATLDVSTDSLAIILCKEEERGKVNGCMFGGQLIGFSLGSILFTNLAKLLSYNYVFLVASILVLIFVIPAFFIKERKVRVAKSYIHELKNSLLSTAVILAIGFAILSDIPQGGTTGMTTLFMKKIVMFDERIIGILSTLFGIVNAVGSYVLGALSDRYGRIKVLIYSTLIALFSTALMSFYFIPFYLATGFLLGGLAAVMCAYFMDITPKEVAATQYAILTSTANFGLFIGQFPAGYLLEILYRKFFFVISIAYVPSLVFLLIFKNKMQQKSF